MLRITDQFFKESHWWTTRWLLPSLISSVTTTARMRHRVPIITTIPDSPSTGQWWLKLTRSLPCTCSATFVGITDKHKLRERRAFVSILPVLFAWRHCWSHWCLWTVWSSLCMITNTSARNVRAYWQWGRDADARAQTPSICDRS